MTEAVIKGNDYAHGGHIRADTILYKSNIRPRDNLFEEFYGISVRRADELNALESNVINVLNARCIFYIAYRYTTEKMDVLWKTVIRLSDGPDSLLEARDRACAEFMEEYRHRGKGKKWGAQSCTSRF